MEEEKSSPLKNFFNSILGSFSAIIIFIIAFITLLYSNNISKKIYNTAYKYNIIKNKEITKKNAITPYKIIKYSVKGIIFLVIWSSLNKFIKPLIAVFSFIPIIGWFLERLSFAILNIINFILTILIFIFVKMIT